MRETQLFWKIENQNKNLPTYHICKDHYWKQTIFQVLVKIHTNANFYLTIPVWWYSGIDTCVDQFKKRRIL